MSQIGIQTEGVDLVQANSASARSSSVFDPSPSVVLIGMRGSGKTFIGRLVASALSWSFIDADEYFETKKQSLRDFVHKHGWPAFRAAEATILEELLTQQSTTTRHVISLGGGIVETPAGRALLKTYVRNGGHIVHIARPIDEIIEYLDKENARPAFGEPIQDVFRRREPWYKECSNYEFVNDITEKATRKDLFRFFQHVTGVRANLALNVALEKRSYFLSLTHPDVTQALAQMERLTGGVDAVELRVDLLRPPNHLDTSTTYTPPAGYVANQLVALRRSTSLPIVFTVRTVSQGGVFPDTAEKEAFELMDLALRHGVEYLDVELSWPEKRVRELSSRKGFSKIIASWHDWSGNMKWRSPLVKEKYDIANEFGDIIKIVGKANTIQDNFELHEFVSRANTSPQHKPVIAINMGIKGQLSRVLNTTLTPVTHPLLPTKAAPGQLSLAEIHKALSLIGQLPPRKFFLFGNPIAESMSPMIHNTGFEVLGFPHVYDLLETDSIGEEIIATMASPDFGGASVTIPFKLDVIPLLDKLSAASKTIGAINTIIPIPPSAGEDDTGSGRTTLLYGDNTDWLGIRTVIYANLPLPSDKAIPTANAALVIGAGGTARAAIYALNDLGAQTIYLYNRTKSKADALCAVFPNVRLVVLETLVGGGEGPSSSLWPPDGIAPTVIVSTVPATSTTTSSSDNLTKLFIPSTLFSAESGVVVDMAYRPAETPLLKLARNVAGARWKTVQGLEVLLEQGYVQFERWTGRRCPREEVSKRVWEVYRRNVDQDY